MTFVIYNYIFFNVYNSRWYVEVVTYFTDLEMVEYYQKRAAEIEVYENFKLRNKLCQIHSAKKSFLMVYDGTYDCYENIKITLWSTISILKPWHVEMFCYKYKMIVKFNYIL